MKYDTYEEFILEKKQQCAALAKKYESESDGKWVKTPYFGTVPVEQYRKYKFLRGLGVPYRVEAVSVEKSGKVTDEFGNKKQGTSTKTEYRGVFTDEFYDYMAERYGGKYRDMKSSVFVGSERGFTP